MIGALGLLSLLVSVAPDVGATARVTRGGYGASFASFVAAHGPDGTDCRSGPCYGPIVASQPAEPEFSFVQTARHRVVGYEEALRRGTPLLQAELEVAEQFPDDVSMARSLTVITHDRYGGSCAVYDLYSPTLAKEFGPKGPGDDGDSVGVEFTTLNRHGSTTYNPSAITLAIVSPVYLDSSANC